MNHNELKINVSDSHQREGIFKLVFASQLSLGDDFLKYQPKTETEKKFKDMIETAIKSGLKDFWRPKYDPSFNKAGTGICYHPGMEVAVGKSYNWWYKTAKNFCPERGSRLGTKQEYIAFLAVLIKELVNSGKSVEWAWNAVCNDSKELGNYCNFAYRKHAFEYTGSREICGFLDLANTYKILAEDEENGGLWLAGGDYTNLSYEFPLAGLYHFVDRRFDFNFSCGWLVLEDCPVC